MGLPKIDLPIFELKLPSTGKKVKYRPFTVKEEKILLVAQQDGEAEQEILATKQIVNNCLIDIDITELPMFDLEYVLLLLRARSIDNSIGFTVKDPDTEETVELELDIDNVKITKDDKHTNQVKINDDFTLFLKYPNIDQFIQIITMNQEDPLMNYFIMTSCLDKVASEDEVHDFKDYTNEQIDEFMENMTGDVVTGIKEFFETMPKMRHEIKYKNQNGDDKTFVIEGMRTFFI